MITFSALTGAAAIAALILRPRHRGWALTGVPGLGQGTRTRIGLEAGPLTVYDATRTPRPPRSAALLPSAKRGSS